MTDAPFYVLPLVGGYAFATIWTASLYRASRESGHRLYFRAVFYAVFLVVCAALLHVIFLDIPIYQASVGLLAWDDVETGNTLYSAASVRAALLLSLVAGPAFAYLLNAFNRIDAWDRFLLRSAINNNDFELLLAYSVEANMPIMFTLSDRKVYVGWVVRAPNPVEVRKAIRMLPMLSGYRDSETLTVEFTTDYYDALQAIQGKEDSALEHLNESDFEIVIQQDAIISAHPFDLDAYQVFQPDNSNCATEQ